MDKTTTLWVLVALILCGCPALDTPTERTPDRDFESLVVIMIDTLRSDHLPSYGYSRPVAPFLAQMAGEGIQLQGYSATSWTRSSVATLLTGLYPQRHRATGRNDRLPSSVPYLPVMLAPHGFSSSGLVANGNVSSQFGFERGFESFEERSAAGEVAAMRLVENLLARATRFRDPYFLYVHFIDPHDPYVPETAWQSSVARADYVQPQDVFRGKAELDQGTISKLIDQYDGEIQETDDAVRRLIEGLSSAGALEGALVVVTSDHGEEFGEHGSLAHGRSLHEEVLRVPFILWSGSRLRPYQSANAFHQVDFVPTMLQALGIPEPRDLDGEARWYEIRDQTYADREESLFHLELDAFQALAIHSPPFKLIRQVQEPTEQLYNLAEDPTEASPAVTPSEKKETTRLKKRLVRLDRRLKQQGFDREAAEASGEVRKQLVALGYLGEGEAGGQAPGDAVADAVAGTSAETVALDAVIDAARVVDRVLDLRVPSVQLLQGWSLRDANGTWSEPRARLALPLTSRSEKILLAGHSVAARPSTRCLVEINGEKVAALDVPPGEFEVVLDLPSWANAASVAYVDLTTRPPLQVPGIDTPVGLHWNRFEIMEP